MAAQAFVYTIEQARIDLQNGAGTDLVARVLVTHGGFDNDTAHQRVAQIGKEIASEPQTAQTPQPAEPITVDLRTPEQIAASSPALILEPPATTESSKEFDDIFSEAAKPIESDTPDTDLAAPIVSPPEIASPVQEITQARDDFRTIANRSAARGENRTLPILIGAKKPQIPWKDTPLDVAPTEEWGNLYPEWLDSLATQFPNHNCAVIAKPNEFVFIDEDDSEAFRKGYEAFADEKFPNTYTTSARPNRCQSHWKQTDATRKLGNVAQMETISVRQHNQYVLAEGSQHKNGVDIYCVADSSPIIPMPDKLVEYILFLRKRAQAPTQAALDSLVLSGTDEEKLKQLLASYPDESIQYHTHDTTLTSIAGKLRQNLKMDEARMYPVLVDICERCCAGYGSDYQEMCQKIAKSVAKYPIVETEIALTQSPAPAVSEWPELAPLDNFLSPVLPFKKEFLPNVIAPWVTDVAERMSVPLDYAGICSLESLAGVIGRRAFVHPKEHDKSWAESICVSGAVVAGSGQIKTPTWKIFLNAITEVEMDLKKEFDSKLAQYNRDMEIWEETEKQAKQALRDGKTFTRFPEPEKPVRMRLTLNDATPEKAHDVMRENPQGIFYYRDELSSWVAELDKKGHETARGLYLSATNGNDAYSVDRIGRDGGFAIMCLGIFGGFQPGLLREFLSESQNVEGGMVPRFLLLAWPDIVTRQKSDRSPNKLAEGLFKQIIRTLATMKPESVQMHFSPEAQKLYWEWDDQNDKKIAALEGENSGKQSHLSKYRGGLPKIAALLQLVDLMVLNNTVQAVVGNHHIDAEHLRKAIALVEYLESHMHRVYDSRLGPVQLTETRLAWRLEHGQLRDGFSAREIQRKGWGGLRDIATDIIEMALENLAEKGWVREQYRDERTPGRPTRRWDINPKLKAFPAN